MSVYVNNLIDWSQLIKFGPNGLEIASYIDVKKAIVKKFQDIYGTDIDLSTNSADGIYLEFYTLMINNLLQSFQNVYSQLNINNANGIYLEILASLKNVRRLPATRSMAAINITNNTGSTITINEGDTFIDINSQTWVYMADNIIKYIEPVEIEDGSSAEIVLFSEEFGPIECKAGSIISTADLEGNITINQDKNGIPGRFEETDSDLRSRCVSTIGLKSLNSISNMEASLINVLGISDVRVYNVLPDATGTFVDGTTKSQGEYVVIKEDDILAVNDKNIGQIIYNKSTPGIPTLNPTSGVKAGEAKTITVSATDSNGNIIRNTDISVYWKKALPIKCQIQFTITKLDGFSADTRKLIRDNVIEYLNGLKIGEKIDGNDLLSAIIYSDPYFMGRKTYTVGAITYKDVEGSASQFTSTIPDNYESYYNFTLDDSSLPEVNTTMTFTITSTRSE